MRIKLQEKDGHVKFRRGRMLDEVRDTMRRLHQSIHAERAYCGWMRFFRQSTAGRCTLRPARSGLGDFRCRQWISEVEFDGGRGTFLSRCSRMSTPNRVDPCERLSRYSKFAEKRRWRLRLCPAIALRRRPPDSGPNKATHPSCGAFAGPPLIFTQGCPKNNVLGNIQISTAARAGPFGGDRRDRHERAGPIAALARIRSQRQ